MPYVSDPATIRKIKAVRAALGLTLREAHDLVTANLELSEADIIAKHRTGAPQAILLSDIAEVVVYFEDSKFSTHTHYMRRCDLDMFFAATVKLHHESPINPHSNVTTMRVRKIEARSLELEKEPFWWTMPSLAVDGSTEGARLINPADSIKLWESPKEIARNEAQFNRED